MAGTEAIVAALKTQLRSAGITYAQAADALGLSEAQVKRLFAKKQFTLDRVETLCRLAGLSVLDLVRSVDEAAREVVELSEAVEQALAADEGLLICAVCVLNSDQFDDILNAYEFDVHELQQHFATLDRLGLIELGVENRYRLRVARTVSWRPNGPVQRFFVDNVMSSFLTQRLMRSREHFHFVWGAVTPSTSERVVKNLRELAETFNASADADARLPRADRSGSALLLAFRTNWEPQPFADRKREKPR